MYVVLDTWGTRQYCWRWATAMEWLACAGPEAQVVNWVTGRALVARRQVRVY